LVQESVTTEEQLDNKTLQTVLENIVAEVEQSDSEETPEVKFKRLVRFDEIPFRPQSFGIIRYHIEMDPIKTDLSDNIIAWFRIFNGTNWQIKHTF
jgi:hypothetical protein